MNLDDLGTYHLYYGDGSVAQARSSRFFLGPGQVTAATVGRVRTFIDVLCEAAPNQSYIIRRYCGQRLEFILSIHPVSAD